MDRYIPHAPVMHAHVVFVTKVTRQARLKFHICERSKFSGSVGVLPKTEEVGGTMLWCKSLPTCPFLEHFGERWMGAMG